MGTMALFLISSVSLFSTTSASAVSSEEAAVKQSVKNYISAVEKKDVNEMVQWVTDIRVSPDKQKLLYNQVLNNNPFSDSKLIDFKQDGEKWIANIALNRKDDTQTTEVVSIHLIKDNGKWKLLIEGVSTRNEKSLSSKAGPSSKSSIITPLSTSVSNYSFSLGKSGG
ncbi:hypothetical protein OB236_30825 [Paenibacillus sp. WQ 127069]|uniref:DUF4878 domain-containing protein n=1 Tax=Paenibacillus baimaensis TaxID=2982185 RepID=A0ABT2UPF2_9BACL|nr:hypothetical protein [Paenibacillus sp. WQ 127069]MCU6796528.1 hypothetical protein [Paenibacillus sp. WQ 127069]